MLDVQRATVRFGPIVAVNHLDLAVASGEVVAVMGPSGSGKSTLLRAIAGLEPLDDGSISFDGEVIDEIPAHRREFGLMFQDYALFPHRDVRGNIAFGLEMHGLDRSAVNRRVEHMLDLVGLAGLGPRAIATLSGGQQQRVALARTLAPQPRLLLLDEPLGSLDRALIDQLLDDMRAIFDQLATPVVYVTHDRDEAFAIADRVAVMQSGSIIRSATPEQLWDDPGSAFVARLIGLDNIIPAATVATWPGFSVDDEGGSVLLRPDRLTLSIDGRGCPVTIVNDRFSAGGHRVLAVTRDGTQVAVGTMQRWSAGDTAFLAARRDAVAHLRD